MRKQTLLSIVLSLIILISSIGIVFTNTMAINNDSDVSYNEPRSSHIEFINTTWDIVGHETSTDKMIYLNANITIGDNDVLELDNTTIIVNENASLGYVYSISVGSGGSLVLESSAITNNASGNTDYELEFAPGSMGEIKNSTISMCGYDSMRGLYVQSQDITFTNSFLDNNKIGINCFKANATLENCWINNSDLFAFVCNDSQVNVYDSKITDNTREYYLENSSTLRLFSSPIPEGINTVMDTSMLEIHWWLTVNVTDLGGSSLEGATVEVYDSYGTRISTGITNLNGQVTGIDCQELTRNETGFNESTPHNVKASLEGFFDAEQEVTMDEDKLVELELKAEPLKGNISGTVKTIDESTIEGLLVTVKVGEDIISDTTDEAGYTLVGVPEGTNYTVIVSGQINNMTPYKSGRNEFVSVVAGETTIVDFILEENPLPVTAQVRARGNWVNANGAEDVDVDTPIKVSFDYPMINTTIEGNVQLIRGSTNVPMTMTELGVDKNQEFLFTPNAQLQKGKSYNLEVLDGVRRNLGAESVAMLWKDYIVSFDTEFEPIVDRNPQPGATNVDTVDPNIFVIFDDSINLNLSSLEKSFGLRQGTTRIEGTVAFDMVNGQKVIFTLTPGTELESLTEYTIEVSDDLEDTEGNRILRDEISRTWNFTTRKTTTEVAGRVADKDGNAIPNATVSLLNAIGDPIDTKISDENGIFEFSGIEPGNYNLSIELKGYKPYTQEVNPGVGTPTNLPQINLEKKAEGDGDEEGIDPMWIILIIIFIIIIIIIAGVAMRKPKPIEEPYEEEGAEERVGARAAAVLAQTVPSAAAPVRMRGAPAEPAHRELKEPAISKTASMRSMSRCPICAHRLMATGECFHCRMDQMYGQY